MGEKWELRQHYAEYTDQTLQDILYTTPETYKDYALDAAREELARRYQPIFLAYGGDTVPFYRIVRAAEFDEVTEELLPYLPKKSLLSEYRRVFEIIRSREPGEGSSLETNIRPLRSGKLGMEVIDISSGEKLDAGLITWDEWLRAGVKKEQILRYGKARATAVFLVKMTVNGFGQEETEKRLAQLAQMEAYYRHTGRPQAEDGIADADVQEEDDDAWADEEGPVPDTPQVRPWVRYFARQLDYTLFYSLIVWCVALAWLPLIVWRTALVWFPLIVFILFPIVCMPAWAFLEAILLSTAGTTPGKWLLRTSVRSGGGSKLSLGASLRRSLTVLICGVGMGLGLVSAVTALVSLGYISKNDATFWDKKQHLQVTHRKIGALRSVLAAVLLIVLPFFDVFLISFVSSARLPR